MDALVKLALVALTFVMLSDFRFLKTSADIDTNFRFKRHTPFLPGDYWKGRRPDFGETDLSPEVMVNGTAKLKCPITHVADSSVSKQNPNIPLKIGAQSAKTQFEIQMLIILFV